MATAEQLLVRIDATTEQLRRELKRADDQVARSTSKMDRALEKVDRAFAGVNAAARTAAGGLGAIGLALSGGAILQGADQALRRIQDIQRTALALGESTATVQELNYTFAQFGLQSEDVSDALNTLADRAQDAVDGTKSMVEDFALLGLTVEDLRGKDPGELFTTLASAVARVEDPTARAAGVVRLLGDDLGRRLLPLLIEGAAGVRRYRQEAQELNVVLGYDAVQAGADAARELAKVKAIFDAQFSKAVTGNADAFSSLASTLSSPEFHAGMETVVGLFTSLAEEVGESVSEIGALARALENFDLAKIGGFLASRTGPGYLYEKITGNDLAALGSSGEQPTSGRALNAPERAAAVSIPPPVRVPNVIAGYEPGSVSYDPTRSMERMEEGVRAAAEAVDALNRKQRQAADEAQRMADSVGFSFSSAFEDAVIAGAELRDVLRGLAQDLARLVLRQSVTKPIADAVSQGISGYFGGGKASGGPVTGGITYLVGERGPELFTAPTSGTIVPNHQIGGEGVKVMVVNQGAPLEVTGQRERRGADGTREIEVFVESTVRRGLNEGRFDRQMMGNFGVGRRGAR